MCFGGCLAARALAALAVVVGTAHQLAVLHVRATWPLTLGLIGVHLVGARQGGAADLLMLLLALELWGEDGAGISRAIGRSVFNALTIWLLRASSTFFDSAAAWRSKRALVARRRRSRVANSSGVSGSGAAGDSAATDSAAAPRSRLTKLSVPAWLDLIL